MMVNVYSRQKFEEFLMRNGIDDETYHNYLNCIMISIVCNGESHPFSEEHPNVCNLVFDDCTPEEALRDENLICFDEDHAHKILAFLNRNEHADICIVHCSAGMSRSGAVGTFVNDLYGDDYENFMRRNGQVKPNVHIYSTLKRVFYEIDPRN